MNKAALKRIFYSVRLCTILGSGDRADYLRKHNVFGHIGEGCTIMERKVPLCPELISLGNNVHLASKVYLIPHDAVYLCLNGLKNKGGGYNMKRLDFVRK